LELLGIFENALKPTENSEEFLGIPNNSKTEKKTFELELVFKILREGCLQARYKSSKYRD